MFQRFRGSHCLVHFRIPGTREHDDFKNEAGLNSHLINAIIDTRQKW